MHRPEQLLLNNRSKRMRTVTIRLLTIILVVCPVFTGLPAAQAQAPQARIKIDIDRSIGEVHPHLFGNFTEHQRTDAPGTNL
jgi:hypothetical protein